MSPQQARPQWSAASGRRPYGSNASPSRRPNESNRIGSRTRAALHGRGDRSASNGTLFTRGLRRDPAGTRTRVPGSRSESITRFRAVPPTAPATRPRTKFFAQTPG